MSNLNKLNYMGATCGGRMCGNGNVLFAAWERLMSLDARTLTVFTLLEGRWHMPVHV